MMPLHNGLRLLPMPLATRTLPDRDEKQTGTTPSHHIPLVSRSQHLFVDPSLWQDQCHFPGGQGNGFAWTQLIARKFLNVFHRSNHELLRSQRWCLRRGQETRAVCDRIAGDRLDQKS